MTPDNVIQNLQRKVHKLSHFHTLSHHINSLQDVDEIIGYTLDKMIEELECHSGSIFLFNDQTQELELRLSRGRDINNENPITKRLGEGISGLVALDGRPILVTNIKTDPRFKALTEESSYHYDGDSFLCVPLITNKKLIGVLNVSEKKSREPFDEEELEFLHILANHAAIAIENRRLYCQIKHFNSELQAKITKATDELQHLVKESITLKQYKENIIDSLTTGIYVVDENRRVTLWNKGMEFQYAIKREDVLGKTIDELLLPLDAKIVYESIISVLDSRKNIFLEKIEHNIPKFDGIRIVNYNIFPLCDSENNSLLGVVVLHDDITEKIDLQNELQVNERLALIGKLSSGIAHELNNPLDGTRRFINLTLDSLSNDKVSSLPIAAEYLHNAKEGVNRMIKIVRSLLEFSRQATQMKVNYVCVNQMLEDTISVLSTHVPMQLISVQRHFNSDLPEVLDYSLQTVFSNILRNAIDAMPDGGAIEIQTHVSKRFSDMVEITIKDTGMGIPEEYITRIFDPFFTTKKKSEGTGLGLAISNEIVKKSGGKLDVFSIEGEGTTFKISIPCKKGGEND